MITATEEAIRLIETSNNLVQKRLDAIIKRKQFNVFTDFASKMVKISGENCEEVYALRVSDYEYLKDKYF